MPGGEPGRGRETMPRGRVLPARRRFPEDRPVRRLAATLAALALLAALAATPAQGAFGLHGLDVFFEEKDGSAAALAGSHPFAMRTELSLDTVENPVPEFPAPEEDIRDLTVDLPPGLVAARAATPQCTTAEFRPPGGGSPLCNPASAVGAALVEFSEPGNFVPSLVYNLVPPPGSVAKLGFEVNGVPVTIEGQLSQSAPYHAVAKLSNTLQAYALYSSELTLWGTPAAPAHDPEQASGGERPFLTLPRSCTGPLPTTFRATSWQGSFFEQTVFSHGVGGEPLGMIDCTALRFGPTFSAQPTSRSADSPSGIDVNVDVDDLGLIKPTGRARSDIKKAVVTLPEGMTANPSVAEGLGTCSEADLERETLHSAPGEGCPQSSKVGTVEVESPLLKDELLGGQLFIASQDANPFHSLLALYLVVKDPGLGILVKLPGKVEPDPQSGRLITTFGEAPFELPQLPLSHVRFHLREGGRSPLITPQSCGPYT